MAVKMEIKLNEEQVRILRGGDNVSVRSLRKLGIKTIEGWKEFKEDVESNIIKDVIYSSGYHPNGYGAWDTNIIKKEDDYYVTWYRGNSCD